jgi:hypothetical protein
LVVASLRSRAAAPRIDINADAGVPQASRILDRLIAEEAG